MRKEIRLSGFGGQGVVLMGHVLGKAAVIDGKNVTLTQSYGPEARGGACSADVIISDKAINYPSVRRPDVLVSMSPSALETYIGSLKEDGKLIIDSGLVEHEDSFGIPATDLAEKEMGTRLVANMVMIGYITKVTELLSAESVKKAIVQMVPKGTEEKNIKAFDMGYDYN